MKRRRKVILISKWAGWGLERYAEAVADVFTSCSWNVEKVDWQIAGQQPRRFMDQADLFVIFEVAQANVLAACGRAPVWLMPNPDFLNPEWVAGVKQRVALALCPTLDCQRIMDSIGVPTVYCSMKVDIPSLPSSSPIASSRSTRFLHVAGLANYKGTGELLATFDAGVIVDVRGNPAQLTVVSKRFGGKFRNVTCFDHVSPENLMALVNTHRFHVYPFYYEGFGFAEREAMAAGGVLIATDWPPFDEVNLPAELRIRPIGQGMLRSAKRAIVSIETIAEACNAALRISDDQCDLIGIESRRRIIADNQHFQVTMERTIAEWTRSHN